jgi:hypothetical protein
MERNAVEWNEIEWSGMQWNGMERNAVEWNGVEWNRWKWKHTCRLKANHNSRTGEKQTRHSRILSFVVCVCLYLVRQPLSGPGLPHSQVSRSHRDAPQSVGLLWISDQLVAETSIWQHTTLTTDRYPCLWWDSNHNLSRRAARDLRLRPRGQWDRRHSFWNSI